MHLFFAQVNIARMLVPLDHPQMADFVNNTTRINALAKQCPGFVWRWKEEEDVQNANDIFNDDFIIVNMSVWESRESVMAFTYQTAHVDIYKRRKEWFSKMKSIHMACWYTQKPDITLQEAKERLQYLNQIGESPYAFTFKSNFTAEESLRYIRKT